MNYYREEREWRKWADETLVHMLSPNVYRTLDEAYKTFNWFSKVSIVVFNRSLIHTRNYIHFVYSGAPGLKE